MERNENESLEKNPNEINERKKKLCENKKCRVYPRLNRSGKIKSKPSKDKFTTKCNVNCKSTNLIYSIEYKTCKKEYIGQTKRSLKTGSMNI